MNSSKYVVTFACYNQVNYTKQCIDSMIKHHDDLSRLVIVDNGSTDDTLDYLKTLDIGKVIINNHNYGCGVAWNQGALALQSEWSIIMNNDILVSHNWIENLISTAEQNNLKAISPSLIEGRLDYDFDDFSENASEKMKNALRLGERHAVCVAIHQSVWNEVGFFQPIPQLLGYEDALFFHELDKAGIHTGTTGASWLHHYGSVTQSLMKQEKGIPQDSDLAYRYNYRLLKQSWPERKIKKILKKRRQKTYRNQELRQHGMTIHGIRQDGEFQWK